MLNLLIRLFFHLHVKCEKKPKSHPDAKPEDRYINDKVYSKDFKWTPQGDQEKNFEPFRPVHDDILIAKLRPGQEIELEVYAQKGLGKDHIKWSPVATASYRLLPVVELLQPFYGQEAQDLVKTCPMGVFDIEDIETVPRAKVSKPRNCTMCRECIREEKWQSKIKLSRIKDHYIFSVESVGILPPDVLFKEAVNILIKKCAGVQEALDEHLQT